MNAARNESARIAFADGSAQNEASVMIAESMVAVFNAYFLDLPLTVPNEALRFAVHRYGEHAKLVSELSSCKTAREITVAQSAFFDRTMDNYQKRAEIFCYRTSETAT